MRPLLLFAVLFSVLIVLSSCEDPAKEGMPNEPEGYPPNTPFIQRILPTEAEPKRGFIILIYNDSDDEDGFVLERKTDGESFNQIADLPANTNKYYDWELDIEIIYTYRIAAYNEFGLSAWSAEKSETSPDTMGRILFWEPVADAYVSESSPSTNYGTNRYLMVSANEGDQKLCYLRFPYNEIPSYTIGIAFAELRLLCQGGADIGTALVYVGDLAQDWDETNVTWNNKPYSRGWYPAYAYVYNDGKHIYWDITEIVQDWVDGKTFNHGIEMMALYGIGVMYAKDAGISYSPVLTVKYLW